MMASYNCRISILFRNSFLTLPYLHIFLSKYNMIYFNENKTKPLWFKLDFCLTVKNSVALVRERTIPTERPPPVGEVSANFCGQRCVTWSAQRVPTAINLCFLDLEPLLIYSSSSSVDLARLTRLSRPRSRRTTTQKNLVVCLTVHHQLGKVIQMNQLDATMIY